MTSIKSAERVLALFEFFAVQQKPATITEISQALGMPQSSTSMLVKNLVQLGYLELDTQNRCYFPTLRIALLGQWIHRQADVAGPLAQLLDQVRRETDETVILAIRNGIYAQYILVQDSTDPLRLQVQSGLLRPMTCCSPGRVFLSLLADTEVGRIIRRTNNEMTDKRLILPETHVMDKVREARRLGYATTDGDMTPGAGSISIALPIPVGKKPLAISVGGPSYRIAEKKDLILNSLHSLHSKFSADDLNEAIEDASTPLPFNRFA